MMKSARWQLVVLAGRRASSEVQVRGQRFLGSGGCGDFLVGENCGLVTGT